MAKFLIRRLLWMLPVALGVVTLVFFLIHLLPGDPVDMILGETAPAVDRAALRSALHLDRPILWQYGHFLSEIARGNLGTSFSTQQPVLQIIVARYPATLELAIAATLIALFIAIPLGIVSALLRDSLADHAILLFSLLGASMPGFWVGPLLIIVFSLQLDLLPVSGRSGIASLILPAVTLGIGMAAVLTQLARSSLLEVMHAEFVLSAKAKGLSQRSVILKHAFRCALIPIVTVVGLQVGALLTGTIITETIFSWPGLGRLTIQAIQSRDYPLVQGCILFTAMTYLFVNLLVDLFYAKIDPRIKLNRD